MNRTYVIAALIAMGLGLTALVYMGWSETAHETGWTFGGRPHAAGLVQPVAFSHKIHVGERGVSCTYCHQFVDKADIAGIPPTETCVACHKGLKVDDLKDTSMKAKDKVAEIGKFMVGPAGAATLKDPAHPIAWKRVYDLPNHVKFPHKMHVKKLYGTERAIAAEKALLKINPTLPDSRTAATCVACHGDIIGMAQVSEQTNLIQMGTCLACHHQEKAATDCFACHY